MKTIYKEFGVAITGVVLGLAVLDMFGIAEQGSLKIAHRGTLGRKAVSVKETLTGATAGLYQ